MPITLGLEYSEKVKQPSQFIYPDATITTLIANFLVTLDRVSASSSVSNRSHRYTWREGALKQCRTGKAHSQDSHFFQSYHPHSLFLYFWKTKF